MVADIWLSGVFKPPFAFIVALRARTDGRAPGIIRVLILLTDILIDPRINVVGHSWSGWITTSAHATFLS